jgi:hypothetical protein
MLLFRSEEHVDTWSRRKGLERGGTLTPDQTWRLACAWFEDRMSPNWRRRSIEEAQTLFADLGLTGDFWRLKPQPRMRASP